MIDEHMFYKLGRYIIACARGTIFLPVSVCVRVYKSVAHLVLRPQHPGDGGWFVGICWSVRVRLLAYLYFM